VLTKASLPVRWALLESHLYVQPKRPKTDKALAVRIEQLHEQDDTMGHRNLAVMLATGKKCTLGQGNFIKARWKD